MIYNIYYKIELNLKGKYLLGLNEEKLKEFIINYEQGINNFFLRGTTYFLHKIRMVKIFDTSKVTSNTYTIEALESKLKYHELYPHIHDFDLMEYGIEITENLIKGSWSYLSKRNITNQNPNEDYVNENRIIELKKIKHTSFDLIKLIKICEELNSSYQNHNYFAAGALVRAIIDHIPPIFKFNKFSELANNYSASGNAKSFKDSMEHLDKSMRKVSDSYLHSQITKSEILPNETQVDCKRDLDVLLAEIIRVLK